MYICYTVNSWKYDNFLNRMYDENYDCWWEHIEQDAYNKAIKYYEKLLLERKGFKDSTLDMNIIMKKKTLNHIRYIGAFPDKEEILFDTRNTK